MKKYFKLFVVLFVLFLVTYSLFKKDYTTNKETTEIKNQEPQYVFGILVDSLKVYNETVKDGQTLGQILYSNHIDHPQIAEVVNKSKDIFDFRTINSGNPYTLICDIDSAETLLYFIYELSDKITYVVFDFTKQPNVYEGKYDVLTKLKVTSGTINSSLSESVEGQGVSPVLTQKMSEMYAWTIDFFKIQNEIRIKCIMKIIAGKYINSRVCSEFNIRMKIFILFFMMIKTIMGNILTKTAKH